MSQSLTQEEFLGRAYSMHGSRYNYSLTTYKNHSTAVSIICTKHGEFKQSPASHMKGSGCKECRKELLSAKYKLTREQFVERGNKKYEDAYDYSKVTFVSKKTPVVIGCVKHGEFMKAPSEHLNSKSGGCNACNHLATASLQKGTHKYTKDNFIERCMITHRGRYSYSKTNYTHHTAPVTITCLEHGDFEQAPLSHIKGHGCWDCSRAQQKISRTYTTEEFIKRAQEVHGSRYDYSLVVYTKAQSKVRFLCNAHGVFEQIPNDHLRGLGCSKCGTSYSRPHQKVVAYLQELGLKEVEDFLINDRKTLQNPKSNRFLELDIYLPRRKLAIEVDGAFFHGHCHDSSTIVDVQQVRRQDGLKDELCKQLDINLVRLSDTKINSAWAEVMTLLNALITT